jgi:hypothetical protein
MKDSATDPRLPDTGPESSMEARTTRLLGVLSPTSMEVTVDSYDLRA